MYDSILVKVSCSEELLYLHTISRRHKSPYRFAILRDTLEQDEGGELVAAGDSVESESRPAPIWPANPDAGQVFHLSDLSCLRCEFAALCRQLLHIMLQFDRKRRFVQIQPQDQREAIRANTVWSWASISPVKSVLFVSADAVVSSARLTGALG